MSNRRIRKAEKSKDMGYPCIDLLTKFITQIYEKRGEVSPHHLQQRQSQHRHCELSCQSRGEHNRGGVRECNDAAAGVL